LSNEQWYQILSAAAKVSYDNKIFPAALPNLIY